MQLIFNSTAKIHHTTCIALPQLEVHRVDDDPDMIVAICIAAAPCTMEGRDVTNVGGNADGMGAARVREVEGEAVHVPCPLCSTLCGSVPDRIQAWETSELHQPKNEGINGRSVPPLLPLQAQSLSTSSRPYLRQGICFVESRQPIIGTRQTLTTTLTH